MGNEHLINSLIKSTAIDTGKISDGFHTFDELYNQRNTLYIVLCRVLSGELNYYVWRTKKHSDKTSTGKGWFVLGINFAKGEQITYHLPTSKWRETAFAETIPHAPQWDKHTSKDVLKRLKKL